MSEPERLALLALKAVKGSGAFARLDGRTRWKVDKALSALKNHAKQETP